MEDDHVDRPGVEAPQGVELTGTNSSIGLIALINAMLIKPLTRLFGAKAPAAPGGRASARRLMLETCFQHDRALMMGGENSPVEMPRPVCLHPFVDLVAMAGWLHPIPYRTRP